MGAEASWADFASVAVTGIALFVGGREFLRAGRWKAAELASSYLRRLSDDEELQLACRALDWGVGPLSVPGKYAEIVGSKQIQHQPKVLQSAMNWKLTPETANSPQGLLYRWVFDTFFSYLSEAQVMIDLDLVRPSYLAELRYWLERIARYRYAIDAAPDEVFPAFIVINEYGQLLRLFDSLKVPFSISQALNDRLRPEVGGDLTTVAKRLKAEVGESARLGTS